MENEYTTTMTSDVKWLGTFKLGKMPMIIARKIPKFKNVYLQLPILKTY